MLEHGAPGFYELVHAVRLAALDAAATQGVPLVVTTFCYSEPEDLPLLEQFEALMARHGGELLPVFLRCPEEEAIRRVGNADRRQRGKIATEEGWHRFRKNWNLQPVPRGTCVTLDTEIPPDAVAREIVRRFALDQVDEGASSRT